MSSAIKILLVLVLQLVVSTQTQENNISVFIEEEHHEVIPHWVDALRKKGWQKADLIHIDGHSDMDFPELVEDLPIGRVPNSTREISAMMQRNDQFIQAAIVGNMLRSVYIILPTWTANASIAVNASIGQTTLNFTSMNQLCLCLTIKHDTENETCQIRNLEHEDKEIRIPPYLCTSRSPLHRYVELTSRSAAGGMLKKMLHSQHPVPLIVDIDEDFFGVQLPSSGLTQREWDVGDFLQVSDTLQRIFCVPNGLTAEEEIEIDYWFQQTIRLLTTAGCFDSNVCYGLPNNSTFSSSCRYEIFKAIHIRKPPQICNNSTNVLMNLERLVMLLSYQTPEGLEALSEIGICLEVASRTYETSSKIGLCLGHNLPGHSAVMEYVPTYDQLIELAQNMTRILKAVSPDRLAVITIARSSRDGYVVRKLQPMIELAIRMILKRVFHLNDDNFFYSKYLAGGKAGWINRHLKRLEI